MTANSNNVTNAADATLEPPQGPSPINQPHIALQTPELLELVLLQVDMRTLLVHCQRVCHSWKALIDNSPALQKKLYFLADFSITPKSRHHAKTLPPNVPDTDLTEARRQCRGIQNELLKGSRPFYRWFHLDLKFYLPGYGGAGMSSAFIKIAKRYTYYNSSWRRMLVKNCPPITNLAKWTVVSDRRAGREGIEVHEWTCPPDDGLRMGQFYDWGFRHGYRDSKDSDRGSLRLFWAAPTDPFVKALKVDERNVAACSEKSELRRRVADTAGMVMFKTVNILPTVNEKAPSETGGFPHVPECWEDEVKLLEVGRWRVGDDVWVHEEACVDR